jgi:hypothetical protein
MAYIKDFNEFLEQLNKEAYNPEIIRMQILAGIRKKDVVVKETYLIQITFDNDSDSEIFEHIILKKFKGSTRKMLHHPAKTHPPVKGHYHVYSKNSKDEIYAVNMDGTAHHQKHRGFEIPRKEAEELMTLGVKIGLDRIIEYLDISEDDNRQLITETLKEDFISIFIEIEDQQD